MALLDMRERFEGSDSPYFFFSSSGGKCTKLLDYFQKEWEKMGLEGSFTFRNLRTSVVHYTKDLSPFKKAALHRQMCHSESVASKFYLPLNTAGEAAEVRRMQEGTPEHSPTGTSEDSIPGQSSTPAGQEKRRTRSSDEECEGSR